MVRAGHAALRLRGEARNESDGAKQGRPQQAVALDVRAGQNAAHFGVANARIAATIPASAPMSQKRMVVFSSGQPMSSKWLCSGDMRKMRLPRSLKEPTCSITETVSTTNMRPA